VTEYTDSHLLRTYAERKLEPAFSELVRRHLDFVYSAAIRMVRDPHLAEDVTQGVFIALAKQAPDLAARATLVGWLHRTTQNIAVQTIRTIERRRAREQEAVSMNELISSVPEASWEQIEQHLDAALTELSDSDRDAVLLRYFQKKSAAEMAQILGISGEAAQKRLNRAVEKLREFFTKRKITVGAGGLTVLISANAVQSAPAMLLTTISAKVLGGTTASVSTTITATKAIAMTALQKTLVTATVVVLAGASIYQARQASQSREQVEMLQQQQAPLAQQIQQLQNERAEATNRLATATAEIAQLNSNQNQAELLKLRGQVGTLRQQLVSLQAQMNSPSSGLEKIMADPAKKDLVDQEARRQIKLRYANLFRELKLSPEQIEKFALTYANSAYAPAGTDVDGQLQSLLGEAGYSRFKEFTQEVPARTTMQLLSSQLGASQLTDEQEARLLKIIKAEPYDLTYGIEGDLNPAFFGTQDQVDDYVRQVTASNQRVVQQAGAFLAPDQLTALNGVLTNALSLRIGQAAALVQKH
jgi:RNA polymerase sigma factor (sigma-70 family)